MNQKYEFIENEIRQGNQSYNAMGLLQEWLGNYQINTFFKQSYYLLKSEKTCVFDDTVI